MQRGPRALAILLRRVLFGAPNPDAPGVSDASLMARVGPANYEDSLRRKHVREMDFTGRPMKGYVFVDEDGLKTEEQLRFWLRRAKDFVATLPPKVELSAPGILSYMQEVHQDEDTVAIHVATIEEAGSAK